MPPMQETAELVASIRDGALTLGELSQHQFERLIAELLASKGWQVRHSGFGDGRGYDLLGITRDAIGFETTWLVGCSWRSRKTVSDSVLKRLISTRRFLNISHVLLVT